MSGGGAGRVLRPMMNPNPISATAATARPFILSLRNCLAHKSQNRRLVHKRQCRRMIFLPHCEQKFGRNM
jgi:hypothetical protein